MCAYSRRSDGVLKQRNNVFFPQIDGRQLLLFSAAGIRLGNLKTFSNVVRRTVHPGVRERQLRSGKHDVSIKKCGNRILETFNSTSFVQDVVDDLFPISQGIVESRTTSVCLRFSIEFLRLRLLMVLHENGIPGITSQISMQQTVLYDWRHKCEVQLDTIGLCNSNRVFNIIPDRIRPYDCPFTIVAPSQGVGYYVTAACIVFINITDHFYDPCLQQNPAWCDKKLEGQEMSISLDEIQNCVLCRLSFDVRQTGVKDALGVWPVRFLGSNSTHNELMGELASQVHLERLRGKGGLPWRMTPAFEREVIANGRGSVGNVHPGKSWWDAEGFADDRNSSAMYCDAISDWWPANWSMPAGYHVTLPCDNCAHRTFDSAFAVYLEGQQKYMVFHSILMRDHKSVSNEHGSSGFCRRGVYGMPMHVTNTMRICTRDAANARYDAAVPVRPLWSGEFGDEFCSDSPFDTPWNIDDKGSDEIHPGMHSVGHVPFFRYGQEAVGQKGVYPAMRHQIRLVRPGVNDTSWGDDCENENLLSCSSDADCKLVELAQTEQSRLRCYRKVCIVLDDGACYAHEHCESKNQMCSGEGKCENFTWQVENDLDIDVEFDVFSNQCSSSDRYDTWGASHWHTIPDILEFYGMCSYRSWFEYLDFMNNSNSTPVDATQFWVDTRGSDNLAQGRSLWTQGKFRVHAHACDRTYMHLDNLQGCAPRFDNSDRATAGFFRVQGNGRMIRKDPPARDSRGEYARTMQLLGEKYVAHMTKAHRQFFNDPKRGFLGLDGYLWGALTNGVLDESSPFSYCSDHVQCLKDMESQTFRGVPFVDRKVFADNKATGTAVLELRNWRWQDTELCGAFGIRHANGTCSLDPAIVPLWYVA